MACSNICTFITFWALMASIPQNSVSQSSTNSTNIAQSFHLQQLKVYSNFSQEGESAIIRNTVDNFALEAYPSKLFLNDNIRSVCGIGAWIFYSHHNFEGDSELIELEGGCADLDTLADHVSSLRPAGDLSDIHKSTFSLYSGVDYTGTSHYYNNSVSDLALAKPHKSIIITGTSDWGIYSQPGFFGISFCLRPVSDNVHGIHDHRLAPFFIVSGFIRSIQKGCTGTGKQVILVGSSVDISPSAATAFLRPGEKLSGYSSIDSLTIFPETDYHYKKKFLTLEGETTRVSMLHRSLIVTGNSSWAIFNQTNFQGHAVCLVPVAGLNSEVYKVRDHQVAPYNIPAGFIKSVRKGCSGNETEVLVGSGTGLASQFHVLILISGLSMILCQIFY